jgi:asparagine synthase (glutamine-hydrolysing)
MCGIAGSVAWNEKFRITRQTLQQMAEGIAHRGPDGLDLWQDDHASLAFARLAILDLDPRAMQPMTDGKRWIVFNGEIYNFRELRKQLEQISPEYQWKSTGDTEVILRAYDSWGTECVQHLNGMFAFAICEPANKGDANLYLARDRMGQKPLYFALRPGRAVTFASELAALRPIPWLDWNIDHASVAEYLQTGYIPAPATIYRGIEKLPPASWLLCQPNGSVTLKRYFDPNESQSPSKISSASVKQSITQAVQRQLVADVPLGCFLSGGIDSSIIAAAMKAAAPDQSILTFSIGFDDPRYDETQYAAQVAKHLGTQHRQFIVRPDAAADLPKLAKVFGEPFGDSSALPTHYLSRETRRHVKVALSGDGGDELFGGYDRYRAMRLATRLPGARHLAGVLPTGHPKSSIARARRFLQSAGLSAPQRYASYVALFDPDLANELFLEKSPTARNIVAETFEMLQPDRDLVQTSLATDRITYLPEDLLTKVDRSSMLHALEVRSPFMDHDLVHLVSNLQTPELLRGGPKRMLREAFAPDLPDIVFRRKKMGFAVPIGDWFRTTLRPMLQDLLTSNDSFAENHFQSQIVRKLIDDHCTNKADHSQRVYALLMLELWWREFGK